MKLSEKHIDALVKLYNLSSNKPKSSPDHSLLGQVDCSESLEDYSPERRKCFRSGLGTLMYLSQERIDCQFAIKSLSSWLSSPTVTAEKCLVHLILYLKGTKNMSLLFSYEKTGNTVVRKLNGMREEYETNDRHIFELFTDSDCAGNAPTRSTILCLNSIIVHSHSRTQKSIALSSCEAELLALTGGLSETLLIKTIRDFMVSSVSRTIVRTDSSSARQWLQRKEQRAELVGTLICLAVFGLAIAGLKIT